MVTSIIGSGIFFTTGFMLKDLDSPAGILFCWFLGGIFAISGALTYSYPAVLFPRAGGDYIYLKEAFSPLLAFMSGWSSLLANLTANISVLALAFGDHVLILFPSLKDFVFLKEDIFGLKLEFGSLQIISILLVLFFTYINVRGVKQAVKVQNFITGIKLGGLILFIVVGYFFGNKTGSLNLSSGSLSFEGIALGLVPVTFSYLGWNMITYLAGEVENPSRNIPFSILLSCLITMGIYLSINLLYLLSAPLEELQGRDGIGVIAAKAMFGPEVGILFTFFILWMVAGSLSSILMGASRVYYAMAKDSVFFPSLADLHPNYGTPYKSLYFQSVYASVLLLFGNIQSLIFMITCAVFLLSTLTALSVFKLKRNHPELAYKLPLYPFPPLLFASGNLVLIIYLTYNSWQNTVWGLGLSLSGIPVYFLFRKFYPSVRETFPSSNI